jgi:hypothetical protein
MSKSNILKLQLVILGSLVAGLLTTAAWPHGYLQVLVQAQAARPAWQAGLLGAAAGVGCTLDYYFSSRCKYFALSMTATAVALLGGFCWATQYFGYWEYALSWASSADTNTAPWIIAGFGAAFMFYFLAVVVSFTPSRRRAPAHT